MLGNTIAAPSAEGFGLTKPGLGLPPAGAAPLGSPRAPRTRPRTAQRTAEVRQRPAFRSFWMGGYGERDAVCSTETVVEDEYRRLLEFRIRTVREEAVWARIDRPGRYDFSSLEARSRQARAFGVQLVWTLYSGPWPDDIPFLSGAFVERFARYAGATALRLAELNPTAMPVYAPINELSFQAWSLFSSGRIRNQDGSRPKYVEIKRQLVRACIAACEAILAKVPHARLLHTDPLEHVVAPLDRSSLAGGAARRTELQFEAWDWISGRAAPGLGGQRHFLDVVGVNYYAENQWELGSGRHLSWQFDDIRRLPLSSLLKSVHARYRRPLAISETGHTGVRRGAWIREIANEVREARRLGIPIEGICLHPLIDQRDRDHPGKWLLRGLWEVQAGAGGTRELQLSTSFAAALSGVQQADRPSRTRAQYVVHALGAA
jgi:UDP-galactopyranose mutase